ncbi:MAG: class I SAM-dependent methyltransferase [Rhodospirillaceae bacterium]|nr:class I SAM-dependent methyltransferase [Rhodospirillaceae bacterium]
MKDDWIDAAFAAAWDASPLAGSPARPFMIALVIAVLQRLAVRDRAVAILEIGSGSGLVTDRMLDAISSAQVDGVDFSQPMMTQAAQRLRRHGARFRQLSMDLTSFDAGMLSGKRYDAIVILQVLHELPRASKMQVLTQLRPHLAAGGILLYGERLRAKHDLFALPHEAVWNALCEWTPDVRQPPYAERVARILSKEDFTVTLAEEFAALSEASYVAEPLVVLGDRCLIAAVPAMRD